MKKYRVGLAGVHRGASLVHPFTVFPETEITALCDLDEGRLAEAGEQFNVPDRFLFTDYEAFLEAPIDIVVVGTPMPLHVEQSVKAMENGKHVLSEVTAATTLEDCEKLVNTVKRTGQIYMMGENACYAHFIRQWKGWLAQGRLGEIFYAEAEYIHRLDGMLWDEKTGETFWRVDRPPIYYCSHSLGPLLYLMEDRVIKACGAHSGYGIMPALGPGCLNMEVALFRTQKGAVIKILRSQVAYREPPIHFYSLYGTKGFVETGRQGGWGDLKGKLYITGEMSHEEGHQVIDCLRSDPQAPPEALGGGHGTTEYYMVRDFIEAVDEAARPPIDVIKAMDYTIPGICAHESAMNGGKWIGVPLFDW
jgi:predicted dehydrogenase